MRTASPPSRSFQAEDELAAVGMALGAGWAGARSMTSTAGPGISLMQEFVGLGYYAEIPTVIFDITRVGSQYRIADANAAVRHSLAGLLLARRYETHRALAGQRRRVLRLWVIESVRSCRKISDADLRDERPRPWHEQLDVGSVPNIQTKKFDRGKVLSVEGSQEAWQLPALRRRGWRRYSVPHAAGNESPGGFVLHSWKRAQRERPCTASVRRLQAQHGSPQQKVRYGPAVQCRSRKSLMPTVAKIAFPGFRYDALGHHRITGSIEPRIQIAGQRPPSAVSFVRQHKPVDLSEQFDQVVRCAQPVGS